jgi:hypothetical protein
MKLWKRIIAPGCGKGVRSAYNVHVSLPFEVLEAEAQTFGTVANGRGRDEDLSSLARRALLTHLAPPSGSGVEAGRQWVLGSD